VPNHLTALRRTPPEAVGTEGGPMRDIKSEWQRSSFCSNAGCLEATREGDTVLLRNSQDPLAEPVRVSVEEFEVFALGVKNGEFDGLVA